MIGYKIVRCDDNLHSACVNGAVGINYFPGKWTRKRKHGPMIFPTIGACQKFINHTFDEGDGPFQIWECVYSEVADRVFFFSSSTLEEISLKEYRHWLALARKTMDEGDTGRLCEREEYLTYVYDPEPDAIVTTQIKLTEKIRDVTFYERY